MKVGSAWAVNSNESSNYNWIVIEAVLRVFQGFSDVFNFILRIHQAITSTLDWMGSLLFTAHTAI